MYASVADRISDDQLWAELDAANAEHPRLVERESEAVAAHLLWAGGDLKRARAAFGDDVVGGWLHSPDLDIGVIGFTPHRSGPQPEEGDLVRVAYGSGVDAYVFESRLMADDDGTWLLDIPSAIGARSHRLTGRTLGCGQWFLYLSQGDDVVEIEVQDLSTGGIGLLTPPDEAVRPVGERLQGRLRRVDGFEIGVTAEVRHVSRLTDHPDWLVTGCALRCDSPGEREELARVLAD